MPKSQKSPRKRKYGGVDGRSTQAKITPLYAATDTNVGCPVCDKFCTTPELLSYHMRTDHSPKGELGSDIRCGWPDCKQTTPMSPINLLDHYNRHTGGMHTCGRPMPDPDDPSKEIECKALCKDRRALCVHRGAMHQNRKKATTIAAESSTPAGPVTQKPASKRDTKRAPFRPQDKRSRRKPSHKSPKPAGPSPPRLQPRPISAAPRRRESPLPDAHFARRMARLGFQSPAGPGAVTLSRRSSNSTLYDGAPVMWSGKTRLREDITVLSDEEDDQKTAAGEDPSSDGYHSEDEVDELLSSDIEPLLFSNANTPSRDTARRRLPVGTGPPMTLQDVDEEEELVDDSDGDDDFEEYQANRRRAKAAALGEQLDDAAVLPSLEKNWKSLE